MNNNQINEISKLNEQFVEFLNKKGIKAKFSLAFDNMKESAKLQHEKDIENNKEFHEFLHTKGFKAKVKLVIENIKKSAREIKEGNKNKVQTITKEDLTKEFNAFLETKGLSNIYTVVIEEN